MKKIVLIILTLCSCVLFASIPKAQAVSTPYDYFEDWEYNANSTNPDYMMWTSANVDYIESATSFSFTWPNLILNELLVDTWYSQLTIVYGGGTLTIHLSDTFYSYDSETALYHLSFSVNNFFYNGATSGAIALSGLTSVSLRIMLSDTPANLELHNETWLLGSDMLVYIESYTIEFYDRGALFFKTTTYDLGNGIYVPDVTIPEGMFFYGWATNSGVRIDLEEPVFKVEYLNTDSNTYKLYAQYRDNPYEDSTVIEPVITDRIPEFVETLMNDINMNTPVGYSGFYVITLIILGMFLMIALYKTNPKTKEIALYVWFIFYSLFWVYIGALPVWLVVIIIGLIIIGALMLISSGTYPSYDTSEEENEE